MVRKDFVPSVIAQDIYDILEAYESAFDIYDRDCLDALEHYFNNIENEVIINFNEWQDENGTTCSIAFVEYGRPQLVVFDVA